MMTMKQLGWMYITTWVIAAIMAAVIIGLLYALAWLVPLWIYPVMVALFKTTEFIVTIFIALMICIWVSSF